MSGIQLKSIADEICLSQDPDGTDLLKLKIRDVLRVAMFDSEICIYNSEGTQDGTLGAQFHPLSALNCTAFNVDIRLSELSEETLEKLEQIGFERVNESF